MEICIIGLPKTGKSTLFNALTRGKSEAVLLSSSHFAPNVGISKVPDRRIQTLSEIFKPKKVINAEIKYTDIAGIQKSSVKGEGIYGPFLNYLSSADAIIQVVRAFKDDNIAHIEGGIDPERDIVNMELELILSDLIIIERKLERFDTDLKAARTVERDNILKEQALLRKIKGDLEQEKPIWKQGLTSNELKCISDYQLLTAKPMLVIINIGEDQLADADEIERKFNSVYSYQQFECIALCSKLEMELSRLSETEALEFRSSLGLKTSAVNRVIAKSYALLELISFFTTASNELKAWTISTNTTALKAAGKIHTDMERGFIRAEVISYSDLEKLGSVTEVKRHGLMRLEGKNYIVQDGDIITFLFNI